MPTPPKSVKILSLEGRSHRTKKELEQREKAEKAQLTGRRMKEAQDVRKDKTAHEAWLRIKGLLGLIEKDDAIYEQVINRYCRLVSETAACRAEIDRLDRLILAAEELHEDGDIDSKEYLQRSQSLEELKVDMESLMMRKRKMLLDIEKENVMTIVSSLRSIPKSVKDEAEDDPMAQMMRRRAEQRSM